ncbi:MAG TPA: tagaturonate epimerase family protein, partial [Verrucomicrobiae bacterium]
MTDKLELGKFSLGMGDRFAHQAWAQLRACILAAEQGADITPVWNKSNREHTIIGSQPGSVRDAAQKAVSELGWKKSWHVDADHIRLETVDKFLDSSDFFTIDVADSIAKAATGESIMAFVERHSELIGKIEIPRISRPFEITRDEVVRVAGKYLRAVQDAGKIYRHIAQAK